MKTLHSNAKIDEKVTAKVICDEWSSCEVKTLEVKVKVKVKGSACELRSSRAWNSTTCRSDLYGFVNYNSRCSFNCFVCQDWIFMNIETLRTTARGLHFVLAIGPQVFLLL